MSSLRLSAKHGLNPTLPVCFYCGQETGEVALLGASYHGEAPKNLILNKVPCGKCQDYMKVGIVLVCCRKGTESDPQPTGAYAVIKEDAAAKLFLHAPQLEQVMNRRLCFIDDEAWKLLGLDQAVAAPEERGEA